jgi:hypothetical protein
MLLGKAPAVDSNPSAQSGEKAPLILRGSVTREHLTALGVEIGTQAGPVTTVMADLTSVPAILDLPGVEAIDAPAQLEPLLNVSAPDIDAQLIWGGTPPNYTGSTGRNVLIGIVDTGLDLANRDFRTSANQTRVKYLWDQTVVGTGTGTFNYGTQYTEAQINAGTTTQIDANGHGTHMAGIAASNGRNTSGTFPMYRYVGIAPEADLIIVKSYMLESGIIDGVSYIFEKAGQLQKDCVVLIAAGHNRGAHDGTHNLDVSLSEMTGPGRIIVAAAGNQGGDSLHAQTNLGPGQSTTIALKVPYCIGPMGAVVDIEAWHNSSAAFLAKLTSPNGFTTGWISPGSSSQTMNTTDGSFSLINDVVSNSRGAKQIRPQMWFGTSPPKFGTWRLDVQRLASATSGVLDAWISNWVLETGGIPPTFTSNVNLTQLVQSPATADSVISVGAYTTKNRWTNMMGSTSLYPEQPPLQHLASFSSPGPRRDGVQRPDLTAPGEGVASSLSAGAATGIGNTFKVEDGVHWVYRGTSVAAAHTAGAVALLLQQTPPGAPRLTPSAVRKALIQRAQVDAFTGAVPNVSWGHGKLDLLQAAAGIMDEAGSLDLSAAYPNPTRGTVSFDFALSADELAAGSAARLRILDLSGREIAVVEAHARLGRQQLVWNGLGADHKPTPPGIYLARLELGTRIAVRKFVRMS